MGPQNWNPWQKDSGFQERTQCVRVDERYGDERFLKETVNVNSSPTLPCSEKHKVLYQGHSSQPVRAVSPALRTDRERMSF